MKATAFSPAHITGFFSVHDSSPDPLHKGSTGAGVSLSHGVTTIVVAGEAEAAPISVFFGRTEVTNAITSIAAVDGFFSATGKNRPVSLGITHRIDVPLGAGFGTSGAGALGIALALDILCETTLSAEKIAHIAHEAEVRSGTGLGTVAGEFVGGFEIRTQPGAPGIGRVRQVTTDDVYKIVTFTLGPLSTQTLLADPRLKVSINELGGLLLEELTGEPTIEHFMELSRRFAEHTGLITEEVRHILDILDKAGLVSSMPMFGKGIFTVISTERLQQVLDLLAPYSTRGTLLVSDFDRKGARSVHET